VDPRADSLSAEERCLLLLARLAPEEAAVSRALALAARPGFSWERLTGLAEEHGAAARVAASLRGSGPAWRALPPETRRPLERAVHAARARVRLYESALGPILAELRAVGATALLMKGAALQGSVFPPGARGLHDVDLLVSPGDWARVARRLEASGFRRRPADFGADGSAGSPHEGHFERSVGGEGILVDLHHAVYPPSRPYAFRIDRLVARAAEARLGAAPALAMSLEDVLVHQATQLDIDGLVLRAGRLADIDAIARSGRLRWPLVVRAAREAGASGVVRVVLAIAAATLGTVVPADALRRLELDAPGSRTVAALLARPETVMGRLGLGWTPSWVLRPAFFSRARHRILYALRALPFSRRPAGYVHPVAPPLLDGRLAPAASIGRWIMYCGMLPVGAGVALALLVAHRAALEASREESALRLRRQLCPDAG